MTDALKQQEERLAQIQKSMQRVLREKDTALSKEYTHGYTLFTLTGAKQVVEFAQTGGAPFMVDWSTFAFAVNSQQIAFRLPKMNSLPGLVVDNTIVLSHQPGQKFTLNFNDGFPPRSGGFIGNNVLPAMEMDLNQNPNMSLDVALVDTTEFGHVLLMGLRPYSSKPQ